MADLKEQLEAVKNRIDRLTTKLDSPGLPDEKAEAYEDSLSDCYAVQRRLEARIDAGETDGEAEPDVAGDLPDSDQGDVPPADDDAVSIDEQDPDLPPLEPGKTPEGDDAPADVLGNGPDVPEFTGAQQVAEPDADGEPRPDQE